MKLSATLRPFLGVTQKGNMGFLDGFVNATY